MKSSLHLLYLSAFFALSVLSSLAVERAAPITLDVWPYPTTVNNAGLDQVTVDPSSFSMKCSSSDQCTDLIQKAIKRYTKYIFFAQSKNTNGKQDVLALRVPTVRNQQEIGASISTLGITIQKTGVPLALGVDESYSLEVTDTGGQLTANTEWGALRGLETFSQLVSWNWTTNVYYINNVPLSISDVPRFPWRGLLVDSARHYLPVSAILRQLDAMSFNRMNVLHWHVVDDQSFPLQSATYPLLSEKGAWTPTAIYTPDDVKKIIHHAHERGIRVVPEFDLPGHASAWGKGYPQLLANCPKNRPLINPTTDYTYTFLTKFLTEMSQLFPDEYVHLGSDEVDYTCWKNDPSIGQWMKQNNIKTYSALQNYFEIKIQDIAKALGKTPILWEESFDNNFTMLPETVISVWLSQAELINVLKSGQRGFQNAGFYLDKQIPNSKKTFYFWEDTWIDFYTNEPLGNATLSPDELKLALGGEASMWGEQVDNTVIDGRIWPRCCAVAERLWSPKELDNPSDALGRLMSQRCKMVRRGIKAGPLRPDYCHTGKNDEDDYYEEM